MKILVTGSNGSLAKMVIPHFLELGHKVIGVDIDTSDLRYSHFFDVDMIFHTAALVYGVVGFHEKPADILLDNTLITANLLKYAKAKKFVYISSSMVYEKCTPPYKEEDADNAPIMSTSYGLSKYVGERLVRSYHEQYGLTYTIWRPFNIITPFEIPKEVGFGHVFMDFANKIIRQHQQPLEIFGDGNQIRCFTSIYDVADALARYSLDERSNNQIFNLANLEPISIKQLAQMIVEIAKPKDYKLEFKHLPIYDDDVRQRIPDVSKMEKVFGWRAKTSTRQSLEEICKMI